MTKVVIGMSGGVDSSVAAALLIDQGYDVTGVYMKNWTEDLPGMKCPWADDLHYAKRVAVQLGIPFKVYDFQTEYKQRVVDYMIAEYQAGRTPNPDIMCNQEVKFKLFLETALAEGADMIATGHYARVVHSYSVPPQQSFSEHSLQGFAPVAFGSQPSASTVSSKDSWTKTAGAPSLLRPHDLVKDQTYFLYRITSAALGRTLFPLGMLTKTEVRSIADSKGLVTARKKDSQGICFVGSVGIKEFSSQYVASQPGAVIEKETGNIIGHHDGAIYYTIGQRHGLNVGGGLPYYVVSKDMSKNELIVSRDLNDESMWRTEVPLTQLHWINEPPQEGDIVHARLRHRGALLPATLNFASEGATLRLEQSERAATAGQSAVLYRGEECLGGGIIN
jgi:tRNA-specific 2-thiouridylase